MRLRWSVYGEDIIDRELLRFSERAVSDMRPAYIAIIQDIMEATTEQFDSEGGRASGGWDDLSDDYAAWKSAQDFSPGTILRATNRLFESLTQEGDEDQILAIEGQALTFGSSVSYGGFHQTGTVKMPMRKPLEFTEIDKVGWMKQLQRYITTGELGAGAVI